MSWTEWLANQHGFFVHIPIAMAVFLPIPLIASQRIGRGIRPWWLVCRYLAIMGFLGLVLSMVSGYVSLPGLPPLKSLVTVSGKSSMAVSLARHQVAATVSLVLGILTMLSMFRKRKDHESLGVPSLLFGLLWSASILVSHYHGSSVNLPPKSTPAPAAAPAPTPVPVPAPPVRKDHPDSAGLLKILDFQSLSPIHAEPVRSKVHGDRWIRVWVSPEATESYRSGSPLPEGTMVVMNTLEDRWGRPSAQPGPVYALEMRQGKPSLSFYWGKIPDAQRASFGGAEKIYWRDAAPELKECMSCHAKGIAPVAERSRWRAPRKLQTEAKG